LQEVGAKIFGVVLNNVNLSRQDYYYKDYYNSHYYAQQSAEVPPFKATGTDA
jgi:hypothetical protein